MRQNVSNKLCSLSCINRTVIVVLAMAVAAYMASAQTTLPPAQMLPFQCVPDCPETPFDFVNNAKTMTFNFGGCTWEVDYVYRYTEGCSTGTYCDIQIRQIRSRNTPPCTNLTPSQIFNAAAFQAIVHSFTLGGQDQRCRPEYPNCVSNWRVDASSCWTKSIDYITPQFEPPYYLQVVGPCSAQESCCYVHYTICQDAFGNYVATQMSSIANTIECTSSCVKVCGQ
jgi:hypothetical protein